MSKRNSKKHSPVLLIIFVVFVILAFVGSFIFNRSFKDPYRNLTFLNVKDFKENGNSLVGNKYKVKGRMGKLLKWSEETQDRLFEFYTGENGKEGIIPIIIPNKLKNFSIENNQKLFISFEVKDRGRLVAIDVKKI